MKSTLSTKTFFLLLFFSLIVTNNTFGTKYEKNDNFNIKTGKEIPEIQQPEFPGGKDEMNKFIKENLIYPIVAQENNIEGIVKVQFMVNEDGSISQVVARQTLYPACDVAAMDVIKKMPKFTPGKSNGKIVPMIVTIPISFKLDKTEKSKKNK